VELVVRGHLNRQIGVVLGIHERTVKVHRGRVMKKMGVRCVANLVQLVARAGVQTEWPEIIESASNTAKTASLALSMCAEDL
jgi:hypothetical protein